jgi:hypothetical protein
MHSDIAPSATEFVSYAGRADQYRAKASNFRRMASKIGQKEARFSLLDAAKTYDVLAQAMDSLEWRVDGHRPL